MITARRGPGPFGVDFTNGVDRGRSDVQPEKGGLGAGFRPHELLEAAVASCMSMTIRMYAERRSWPLKHVVVRASLDRSQPDYPVLEYTIDLDTSLADAQRTRLKGVAKACPVLRTLTKAVTFVLADGDEG